MPEAFAPVVVPARGETTFDQIRLANLVIQQANVGGLVRINYTLAYYSPTAGDAPADTVRTGSTQLSLAAMLTRPGLAEAVQAITAALTDIAVEAGVLPAG